MVSALRFASENESVWQLLSNAKTESESNDSFRKVQQQFSKASSVSNAMGNLDLSDED